MSTPHVTETATIVENYAYLEELLDELGEDLDETALPYFCDWLTEKVYLIEIRAASDEDAYTIFETMNDRGLSLSPLDMLKGYLLANISDVGQRNEAARLWRERMDEQGCDFDGTSDKKRNGLIGFGLNQWSMRYIKLLLARMTAHLEAASGVRSQTSDYLVDGRGRYEIEHIWADHPERHGDEFASPAEFAEWRNRFGGLLLLPKTFNASYGDLPYADKRQHYVSQNLLARSLHEQCYERHPGFLAYIREQGLPFEALPQFRKAEMEARQQLYRALADRVWDPQQLRREVQGAG